MVIPAHNEASVILRCLESVRHAYPQEMPEVIVVANNCSDDTAQKARDFHPDVKVIETPIGSKTHALNLGDQAATGYPRFYVDADIALEKGALQTLCEELEKPGVFAVLPQPSIELDDRSWSVRAYYKVWRALTWHRTGMVGSGVYGLSEQGRARFERFPKITADDNFVRLQFSPTERVTVRACKSFVTPPKDLTRIIDIMTRSYFGNEELKQQFPHLFENEDPRYLGSMLRLVINPLWWPAISVYLYVKLATKRRVRQRFERGEVHKWERDDSSREATAVETKS